MPCCREQQDTIFWHFLAFKVFKVPCKPSPIVDFEQQLGDLDLGQQGVDLPHNLFGFFGNCTYQRRDFS